MKIIEAMKQVKANKEKIADLQTRISQHSANLSFETPAYENQKDQIQSWLQTCLDISRDNVELLVRIAKTNLATSVSIEIAPGKSATKTIAEWVWRRREYIQLDTAVWSKLTDRGLKETQSVQSAPGTITEIKLVRFYDPKTRDDALDALRREPHLIDGALEVVNATTDLLE